VGDAPRGVSLNVRGQLPALDQTVSGLETGLLLAVGVIFLLLAANYQSFKMALAVLSTAPAVLCGVLIILLVTGTTLNIQSFMGAIMAIGIAMANSILLVTFAETGRRTGLTAVDAAVQGAGGRLRAILMTAAAMSAMAGALVRAIAGRAEDEHRGHHRACVRDPRARWARGMGRRQAGRGRQGRDRGARQPEGRGRGRRTGQR